MSGLSDKVVQFLHGQGFLIVSTVSKDGYIHNACKGLVEIDAKGRVYILDLYEGRTYENLKDNPRISITAVDEHKFTGFCLKGEARIIPKDKISPVVIKAWEDKVAGRITRRVIKNMREEKGHPHHPEAALPKPKYVIAMEVKEVIDLTPHHLK